MQNLENVCEQSTQAEQGSVLNDTANVEKEMEGLADLGKFKDVNALMQAYASLQAEFTRRSQRLKRYEQEERNRARAVEDTKRSEIDDMTDASNDESAGFSSPEDEKVEMTETNQTSAVAGENCDGECDMAANDVGTNVKHDVAVHNTPSLYNQVMANEEVRLKIIGDYLSSIGKSGAPLIQGGTGVLTTPLKKPRSIQDAGTMALAYLTAQKRSQ